MKDALIIFTRNPELGKCKTRLAKTIGDEAALHVYKHLLNHTAKVAREVPAERYVFYSENIIEDDIWDSRFFKKQLQAGCDLGERMHNAFKYLFLKGFEKVVIIGSDLLDLDKHHIQDAFQKLNEFDVVLGPAKDGGYYLLGMKKNHPIIFKNKSWGSSSVRKDTLHDLKEVDVFLLETLNDIDTFEDAKHYKELKPYYQ